MKMLKTTLFLLTILMSGQILANWSPLDGFRYRCQTESVNEWMIEINEERLALFDNDQFWSASYEYEQGIIPTFIFIMDDDLDDIVRIEVSLQPSSSISNNNRPFNVEALIVFKYPSYDLALTKFKCHELEENENFYYEF